MILWCDGGHGPAENMRRDAALLDAAAAGAGPVLRLFTFVPAGITLGRAQDPARELDLARCAAAGVPWAVRPTGGRAVYHDEEWTYSIAAGLADPSWGGGLEVAYGHVSRLIVASLARLGVPAMLSPGAARGDLAPRSATGAAAPCFASTARHEIVLEGRKLVGSAQRRTARALLQQGSLLTRSGAPAARGLPGHPGPGAGTGARGSRAGRGARRPLARFPAAARALGRRPAGGVAPGHAAARG